MPGCPARCRTAPGRAFAAPQPGPGRNGHRPRQTPPPHHGAPADHFFRNPGKLPADHCDARHTVQSHERVMHPGLQPVGLVVVRLGNRGRDELYGGHRPPPGPGPLPSAGSPPCPRRPGAAPRQHFRCLRSISEGSKVTPRHEHIASRRETTPQPRPPPTQSSSPTRPDSPAPHEEDRTPAEAAHMLDAEHGGTPRTPTGPSEGGL
jgi:hypothetical protein